MNKDVKISYHNDVFFKYMLCNEDEDSIYIRHEFIRILTGIKPKMSHILNPEINAEILRGKNIVLDVHVKDEQGREYDIEMQVNGETRTEMMRFEYYGAKV